jgi:thymidylate synthase
MMDDQRNRAKRDAIRGDGLLPVISVEADNLAEATHKAIIACHDHGTRVETPKHRPGMSLGYDADMIIRVRNADAEPKVYYPGIHDDDRGIMQYILEVTHGIHNSWKKDEEHPDRWGYTYNERFVDQLPFVFQRIKADWEEKRAKEGAGRITGRDYQFTIWRAGEDIILEQNDPPCFQRGHIRFLKNKEGEIILNYITDWRSRDLLKAWNENNIGQIELQRLIAAKVSDMLGVPIKMGAYIDRSSSLHLYGLYVDRDNLEKQIQQMKKDGWEKKSCSLHDYLTDTKALKRIVAAQNDAYEKGHGLNLPGSALLELGYDVATYAYPEEWDTWPRSWDADPDPSRLARVP